MHFAKVTTILFVATSILSMISAQSGIPQYKSLIINEIMYDPSPTIGLPNAEYIELLNRADHSVVMSEIMLTVNGRTVVMESDLTLPAGALVLLTGRDHLALFSDTIMKIAIDKWSSLSNVGADIVVSSRTLGVIDSISYDPTWHDPSKRDGGWSLELVSPMSPCRGSDLWRSNTNWIGGTPGVPNSAFDVIVDVAGPELVRYYVAGDGLSGIIEFNEELWPFNGAVSLHSQSAGRMHPTGAFFEFGFSQPLNVLDTQLMISGIHDCLGNPAFDTVLSYRASRPPQPTDLVINELMYDPAAGHEPYVEVLNHSDAFIDLTGLVLITDQSEFTILQQLHMLEPGAILAYHSDPQTLVVDYPRGLKQRIRQVEIPNLDRTGGSLSVVSADGELIEVMIYHDSLHSAFVQSDARGVALERTSSRLPATHERAWASAAGHTFGGTPGAPNSQVHLVTRSLAGISITPRTFSPDGDGDDDILHISFGSALANKQITAMVFDSHGRQVYEIIHNELLGSYTTAIWDGYDSSGKRCGPGVYIIVGEAFDERGKTQYFRQGVVLAQHF